MPFVRLGYGKGMEGCLLRRRETENGNGTSLLSQVFYTQSGTITCRVDYIVFYIRPGIKLKGGIYMQMGLGYRHSIILLCSKTHSCSTWMKCRSCRIHLDVLSMIY